MAAFTRRQYAGAAASTTITGAINATDTTVGIAATTGWPSSAGVPFYVVIDPGTSSEEKCSATISGSTLTLTRAQDDTTGKSHSSGATIYPVFTANDADEANELVAKLTTKGDLLVTDGSALNRLAVGANTTFLKANSGATNGVEWDAIDLGTDTTGNYVATIAGTSNQITVSGSGSESAAVTLSTPQDIHTGATPTFAGGVFSGSTTGDLLRITQTGSGNALVVEDSTNPDSTPFVVNASGRVGIGVTAPSTPFHVEAAGGTTSVRATNTAQYNHLEFIRQNGTSGSPTTVASGNILSVITNYGYDGAANQISSRIFAEVDGTVSSSVVPGRLTFYTSSTAGTSTERMRIDSAGAVGIGGTPLAGDTLRVSKNITGATNGAGVYVSGAIQSDVTTAVRVFRSSPSTANSNFTLTQISHYSVVEGTYSNITAGGAVTNQYGFLCGAMTQGTNIYGFFGQVAAASNRWNLHMEGTAANYLAGRLGVGATLTSGAMAQVTNTTAADVAFVIKGAASQSGLFLDIENSAGTSLVVVDSAGRLGVGHSAIIAPVSGIDGSIQAHSTGANAVGSFRWSNDAGGAFISLSKGRGSIGSYTTVNSGDVVGAVLATAADGTGFVEAGRISFAVDGTPSTGVMPGRIVFSTSSTSSGNVERMRIDSSGQVGIGAAPSAGRTLTLSKNVTGATSGYGIFSNGTVQSDVTASAVNYRSSLNTAAASFTLSAYYHFQAAQGTVGATSTVTTQIGFVADSSLTGATNNYGFLGDIAAATGRYNLYMNGTAANYLAGRLGVGATLTSGAMAQVVNTTAADKALVVKGAASQSGTLLELQDSAGTALAYFGSGGNFFTTTGAVYSTVGLVLRAGATGSTGDIYLDTSAGTSAHGSIFFRSSNAFTERMRINPAGEVGIGTASVAGRNVLIGKNITGATTAFGMVINSGIQSDVTGAVQVYRSGVTTAAASFTLPSLTHFYVAGIATPGSGSTITNQYGFFVDSNNTGATNNFAFYGDIAAGTGRWNLYMFGTARNYLAGGLEVVAGTTGMTTGFTHIPAAAGAPTGAPTNPTGNTPLYYDTTNNKLYVYNGAWKSVTLA